MSLIPSESYSFPDHFMRTVTPSPKPTNEEPEAPVRKIPFQPTLKPKFRWNMRTSAMDAAPVANNDAEQPSNEALRPAAQNVIQMKPARPAHPPRIMPPPESLVSQNPAAKSPRLVAVSNLQADFFGKFPRSEELLCRSGVAKQKCVDSLLAKARYWPFCCRLRSWGCRGLRTMSGWFGS